MTTATEMAPILDGLRSTDAAVMVQAVRALGRFERPDLVKQLLPMIAHTRPGVRAEAINALGQALSAIPRGADQTAPLPPEVATVTKALLARVRVEPDPYVAGVAAETLGRLPFRTAEAVAEVEVALAALLPSGEGESMTRSPNEPIARVVHPSSMIGAVKGLETRVRLYQKLAAPAPLTVARLRTAAAFGSDPSDGDLAFVRRVAWMALNTIRGADLALIERALDDPDVQVRRLAISAAGALDSGTAGKPLSEKALRDSSFIVRHDAVRAYSRTLQATDCAPLIDALGDKHAHVVLAAIDVLGAGCPAGPSPVARLISFADALPAQGADWHRAAHAFVSLSRLAREDAASRLVRFAEHPTWQVRMYAARAATVLAATGRLERLTNDAHDNVREAAIAGLVTLRGHDADGVYISALARRDYQLVLTAANALKGSPNAERAVPALLDAFARITAENRDTSRDPRVAILERLREFGGRQHAPKLQSCLADFDAAVAQQCAAVLQTWTGTSHQAKPTTRAPARGPRLAAQRARLVMRRGGPFEIRLFPDEAPATVARFVRLARQGHYNGLTFHRVVPNFVIQGGSPGANEYMGDGPFMRDELGLRTHARGTLGISTRGRDTGDAQIFVNLVDNPRLDHNFTVFAEVASGMEIVDGILEGDVIERVDVLESTATQSGR